ncbi:MAG: zinc-dependent peptidase [Pirellulales bacterium]
MIFSWLRNRRRRQRRAAPFPSEWQRILAENVRLYALLTAEDQEKLRERIKIFVPEKKWVGCADQPINDEVQVTIAAQACLLLLGVEESYCFDDLLSILVYPNTYTQPPKMRQHQLVVEEQVATLGEAWKRGPIVLTWAEALRGGRQPHDGHLLVIHEFAHHVDGLDGDMDGTPPLRTSPEYHRWDHVVRVEYNRLVRQTQQGRATLLDQYGASSRAEFFAVASECFFGRPLELRQQHTDLYEILQNLYRQDPAQWPGYAQAAG